MDLKGLMIWNYKDIESFDNVSMMKMMSTYEDKRAINVYVNEDLKGCLYNSDCQNALLK